MRTFTFIAGLTSLIAISNIAQAQGTYTLTPSAPAHLNYAESLAIGLGNQIKFGYIADANNVEYNRYGASWSSVNLVIGQQGYNPTGKFSMVSPYSAYAVCSNFVSKVLQNKYNWNWKTYNFLVWNPSTSSYSSVNTASPDSSLYFNAIENGLGMTEVANPSAVLPGDICVIKYLPPYDANDSGHTMIVRRVYNRIAIPGTNWFQWTMEVVDCSKSGHSEDTRSYVSGGKVLGSGVGIGKMSLVCDGANSMIGYSWSARNFTSQADVNNTLNTNQYWQTTRPMKFGRLKSNAIP